MAKTTKPLLKDVADFQASAAGVQVPVGYEISTPREHALWMQYTSARPADEWLDAELVQVCLVIKADLEIERLTAYLDEHGDLSTAGNGAIKAHRSSHRFRTQCVSLAHRSAGRQFRYGFFRVPLLVTPAAGPNMGRW
ncbi:hypothetical protein [Ruegeria sp. HKCCA5763]|uniref:hypothetical protein n=1 Tax=Ruegeria sp. HKCCA5763 TaxID=2682987 RepID=UPI001488C1EF|nr:hypothetical protein [Ruegeria sp. HKCCA5763]